MEVGISIKFQNHCATNGLPLLFWITRYLNMKSFPVNYFVFLTQHNILLQFFCGNYFSKEHIFSSLKESISYIKRNNIVIIHSSEFRITIGYNYQFWRIFNDPIVNPTNPPQFPHRHWVHISFKSALRVLPSRHLLVQSQETNITSRLLQNGN